MTRLRVLVLHRMGDPRKWREAVRSLEYMIPDCLPDVHAIVHDADLPLPGYVKDFPFDLIVLGPTFLGSRYQARVLERVRQEYAFIREAPACKIALPQDDYDCSAILDDWMVDWAVDRVYTVIPDHWDVLYPRSSVQLELRLGYTGYVADEWIDSWRSAKPHEVRSIDVSYRASRLPANFGRLGFLKSDIARRFTEAIVRFGDLRLDISVDPKDMIPGSAWHAFTEDSRFCLATPSGSSLLDPRNEIRQRVLEFTASNPVATFDEVERHCFAGLDGHHVFSAISPRNLEAALAGTVQIATPGSYSGLLKAGEHFVSLEEDCANIADVWHLMRDFPSIAGIRQRAKEAVLSEPRLRRTNFVEELRRFAEDVVSRRHVPSSTDERAQSVVRRYALEMEPVSRRVWRWRRALQRIRARLDRLGGQSLQSVLSLLRSR